MNSSTEKHSPRRRKLADVEAAAYEAGRTAGFEEGIAATKLALLSKLTKELEEHRATTAVRRRAEKNLP